MPRVFVTDASERAALAVIRSLGNKGIEVTAGDSVSFNAGFLSKYCEHRILYPSPERDRERFVKFLLDHVKENKYDLLVPVTDFTAIPLSRHKDEFECYVRVAVPPFEVAVKAFDKARTVVIADEEGIRHPRTFMIEDLSQVEEIAAEINYPAVIKPRMSIVWLGNRAVKLKVTPLNYTYGEADLVTGYTRVVAMLESLGIRGQLPIVQEYVQGDSYGVEALIHDSKPVALFMHRRLREYPITGGASTLRESAMNPEVMDLGVRLLKAMGWDGVAMVEFKIDRKTREPMLIEVNGRLWGSLPLAILAGVDFPFLLYKTIVDGEEFPEFDFRIGVKSRWLIPGDTLWLFSCIMRGRSALTSIKQFIESFTVPDDVMMASDPAPTLGALKTAFDLTLDVLAGRRSMFGEDLA